MNPKDKSSFEAHKNRLVLHLHDSFAHLGLSFKIGGDSRSCLIEVRVEKSRFNSPRGDYFDGLEIVYYYGQRLFEVIETMAGPKENELWVYRETKSATVAVGEYMKGNKRKSQAIRVWV